MGVGQLTWSSPHYLLATRDVVYACLWYQYCTLNWKFQQQGSYPSFYHLKENNLSRVAKVEQVTTEQRLSYTQAVAQHWSLASVLGVASDALCVSSPWPRSVVFS